MKPLHEGQLVKVTENGTAVDGIVFQVESVLKAIVAVPDEEHGAAFRTVHRSTIKERQPGEHDDALRKAIKKSQSLGHGPRGSGPSRGLRGHTGAAGHRTTSK